MAQRQFLRTDMTMMTGKRITLVAGALLALAALVVMSLPLLASSSVIRERIAAEMGEWSGYRVQLGAAPEISLFPSLTTKLRGVRFYPWSGNVGEPAMTAEEIDIGLSAFGAVFGDIRFTQMRIVRPVVYVADTGRAVALPVLPQGGRLARAVWAARQAIEADPAEPDLSGLPDDALGVVSFADGLIAERAGDEVRPLIASIDGTLNWPRLNRPARLSLMGNWRGENVEVTSETPQPLLLFAGSNSPFSITITSKPATLSFEGTVMAGSEMPFADGALKISSPSMGQALEWVGAGIVQARALGQLDLSARLNADGRRAKLDEARLTLGDNPGAGILEFSFTGDVPSVSATLAFQTLDLYSLLNAFSNPPIQTSDTSKLIDTAVLRQMELDLRLSAAEASLGPVAMEKVAATAQVNAGLAAFDISDATAFGGTIQAGLRFDYNEGARTGEIRALATDIDSAQLADAIGAPGLVPRARGTISLILKGPAVTWRSLLARSRGSFSAKFHAGTLPNVNMDAVLERAQTGEFFALRDREGGDLSFKSAEVKADISNGVARVEKIEALTPQRRLLLSGIVPYMDSSLALSATVFPLEGEDLEPIATFFIGGSWNEPYVWPVPPLPAPGE